MTTAPLETVRHIADELVAAVPECTDFSRPTFSDATSFLEMAAEIERLGRIVDAMRVRVAGELMDRSRAELGDQGLSRSANFTSPAAMLASFAGCSRRQARARLSLGQALRSAPDGGSSLLDGAPPLPRVSEALDSGALSLESASVVARLTHELDCRGVARNDLAEAETILVDAACAGVYSADDIATLSTRIRDHLDPDGLEPKEERQQRLRGLRIARRTDGMYRGTIALTPEQAGIWMSAAEALMSPRVLPRFRSLDDAATGPGDHVGSSGSAAEGHVLSNASADTVSSEDQDTHGAAEAIDTRTRAQKLVDAVTELIARAAGSPTMPKLSGALTTVNVHIGLNDLESGRGRGWIDGIDEPLSASVIRELACSSPRIPTVFRENGEILYHGKARRLFSAAQNRALAARDGGCVWPGCDRPPSWCETHHVSEWRHPQAAEGRTDIDNGVLLCHFHHRNLHRSEWQIVIRHGMPHIVPPGWIDADQVPVPVTQRRTRFDINAYQGDRLYLSMPRSRPMVSASPGAFSGRYPFTRAKRNATPPG